MNKRLLAGIAAAGIIGGGTYGFAASLGVTSDDVSAGNASVVASCDDTVDVNYTVAWSTNAYFVDSVTVTGIEDDCIGDMIGVTLDGASDETLTQEAVVDNSAVADENTSTFTASGTTVTAASLADVHVVIAG
jgi:hypothetical protein